MTTSDANRPAAAPRPPLAQQPQDLRNKRVTVVGLGRFGGGVGVTRWLCAQGARVTVSDSAQPQDLRESVAALEGCRVELHLGGNDIADVTSADLVVLNPAVRRDSPLVHAMRAAGVKATTEINLFIQRCRGGIVGITGSVGKSTTTAMLGMILARRFTTHVGGNIGRSLLDVLDDIRPEHVVVLELSSFQLDDLPLIAVSPHVAVVTNLARNHLDVHGTMDAYAAAKKNIFRFQSAGDVLVLNRDDALTAPWAVEAPGRVTFFGRADEPFELTVPGEHNRMNARAAFAAAAALGVSRSDAAEALRAFTGLPHRLQFVRELRGVRYYNDSKCTTPEGAAVAMDAFEPRRAVMILGGSDKHASFDELGKALAARAKGVIALGQTRERILAAVEPHLGGPLPIVHRAASLAEAVDAAWRLAQPGDAVLLSPACASYDMFRNYEHRGQTFVDLVNALAGDAGLGT